MVSKATNTDDVHNSIEEEEIEPVPTQYGYRLSIWRSIIMYPLALLPVGIGLLLAYWFPYIWVKLTCSRSSLRNAHLVIVKNLNSKWNVEIVRQVRVMSTEDTVNDSNVDDINDFFLPYTIVRYFVHKHLRYIYNEEKAKFVVLKGYEGYTHCTTLLGMRNGLDSDEQRRRYSYYGPNIIDVPVKSYHVLLIEEILHPFYIFQILSIIFWMVDEYFIYSGAVLFIFVISILISLIQTRRHMQQLHDMVITSTQLTVLRNGRLYHDVSSETLVPGDVLAIPTNGILMTCDAVLLNGDVIVNESMLTGESIPITKTTLPMEHKIYHPQSYKRHTLFAGSQVIQSRHSNALALVIRTGFLTTKGSMVRSILFPKPLNMKFYWDSIKFILILSVLACCAFIYTILICQLHQPRYQVEETILRAFDIITTVVPPSLPAAITIGTIYALNRLKKNKIYCISPQRVNLCGKVKLVCFDKTGTLTEDSLDMLGVQTVSSNNNPLINDISQLSNSPLLYGMASCHSVAYIDGKLSGDPLDVQMFRATNWILEEPNAHSLHSIVHPIKYTAHANNNPSLESEDVDDDVELAILKLYTFSSELQRMSVLVSKSPVERHRDKFIYVKGAPETIKKLSQPETIPADFNEALSSLTQKGYRVLAMGHKRLRMNIHKADRLERNEVECNLNFCGFVIFENKLKPQSAPILDTLRLAAIRTVMITGDNLLTAIAVSKSSGMIDSHHHIIILKATPSTSSGSSLNLSYHIFGSDNVDHSKLCDSTSSIQTELSTDALVENVNNIQTEFHDSPNNEMITYQSSPNTNHVEQYFHIAVDGHAYTLIRQHDRQLLQKLLVCGTVFARMSPVNKKNLVSDMMTLGYGVAMCGDGANDCGALKAAHVGISLSESEASVASPFTSKIPNISCVPIAIKEGRAALVTSFSVFKFMALYSLTEFTSVAILYAIESNFGNWEYLYIDMVLILAFAFVMGLTGPYPHLVKRRPLGTLAGLRVYISILSQYVLMCGIQLAVFFYLRTQNWFTPLKSDPESENIVCWENTAVFTVSTFQYVLLAVAFSTAAPYRKPLYTNLWFMGCLAILLPINFYITLAPPNWLPEFWTFVELVQAPSFLFRLTIVMMAGINFLLAYLLEGYVFPSDVVLKLIRYIRCKRNPKNLYKRILKSVNSDPDWPPTLYHGVSAHC